MNLPRGIRFEPRYQRYRVRKYVDGKAFLGGDYKTLEEAQVALKVLEKKLKRMERAPRTLGARAALLRMGQ